MSTPPKKIVTRFAPSPTGLLHGGNYRTAIFAYLFARAQNGSFVLRIEDTDLARSKKEYEENIIDALDWLTLDFDALYHQRKHAPRHRELLEQLVQNGKAYVSKEATGKEGDRAEVIRFRNPNIEITFSDIIRGSITVNTTDLGDFVIARSFTEPVFHFAVVADDADAGITHVIRGEDHISNTPRQILIMEALGFARPQYAHLPLVLGDNRTKLSKRHGARPITQYRELGFLPEALLNYLAMVGWNPGTEQEIFTKAELIQSFTLPKIQPSPGIFDEEKLRWVNKQHLSRMPLAVFESEIQKRLGNHSKIAKALTNPAALQDVRERVYAYSDIVQQIENGEFDFYEKAPTLDSALILWKKDPSIENTVRRLQSVIDAWKSIAPNNFLVAPLKDALSTFIQNEGAGNVLWPVRYALSGKVRSPEPFTIAEALGHIETLKRLHHAISVLNRNEEAIPIPHEQ